MVISLSIKGAVGQFISWVFCESLSKSEDAIHLKPACSKPILKPPAPENNEIKLTAEMLNLLGCNKDNFLKLIKKMNYKIFEKNDEVFFKYFPKNKNKKIKFKNIEKDNPFNILNQLNIK